MACKVINFLAQVENFQKKLWLKKKLVVSTGYCITLDKIPEKYYEEITANTAQLAEWKVLFGVELTNALQLTGEPYLVLDTKHFTEAFTDKLLAEFDDLDAETDGLLINSENFQALNLLQEKYNRVIDAIYGDPPYNAKSSEIIYKNSFKHSSWLSFMFNRVELASTLKTDKGAIITAIDENEVFNLMKTFDTMFPEWSKTVVTILHNPAGVQGDNFSYSHEYAIFMFENYKRVIGKTKREKQSTEPFRDWGPSGTRNPQGNTFYPIYVDLQGENILEFGEPCRPDFHPESQNILNENSVTVYPIGDEGDERKWVFARETVEEIADELSVTKNNGVFQIMRTKSKGSFKTVWNDSLYYANIYGSKLLNNILGKKEFDFPKSVYTVKDCIFAISRMQNGKGLALDYFAGSGTTGHATIKLNREDGGKRKYILVEMGTYFNTVTKPRIQKVIYSDNWKGGQPQDKKGISQLVKYQTLESYEDVLNNLVLQSKEAANLFSESAKEQYQLRYMLDLESREHLFHIGMFHNPFNYTLNTTQANEQVPTVVDLVETFNYLVGLYVQRQQRVKDEKRDIKLVEGKTREGKKTLVIWRNLETTSNEETQNVFRKLYDSTRSAEFDQIFINGDHHFENIRQGEEIFKVKGIEEEFFKRMFNS